MNTAHALPLLEEFPDESPDRLRWDYLAKLALAFAVLVAGAAIWVLVYAYMAVWYLTNA